jgi:hypothetical protein
MDFNIIKEEFIMDQRDYKRSKKYFKKVNLVPIIIAIIIGIALFPTGGSGIGFGVLILIVTAVIVSLGNKGKPIDVQIDALVAKEFESLEEIALQKHGIAADLGWKNLPIKFTRYWWEEAFDEEAKEKQAKADAKELKKAAKDAKENVKANKAIADENLKVHAENMVEGRRSFKATLAIAKQEEQVIKQGEVSVKQLQANAKELGKVKASVHLKKGKDKIYRASFVEGTILLFSEAQLFSYTRYLSLITPEESESCDEYFYGDILSVSAEQDEMQVNYLTIKTASGDINPIAYDPDKIDIQSVISVLRGLIREDRIGHD